jgi:hypothetical protein
MPTCSEKVKHGHRKTQNQIHGNDAGTQGPGKAVPREQIFFELKVFASEERQLEMF